MLVVLIMLLCSMLLAPELKAEMGPIETPRSGLEFQVDNDFQLSSFSGSMISWKRLSSEHRGWRVGLSPMVHHYSSVQYRNDLSWSETEDRLYSLDVVVQKLFLGSLNQNARSYWGIGPMVGIYYEEQDQFTYNPEGEMELETLLITRSWDFGVSAIVGVEYFVLPNVSLHGEYGFNFVYSTRNSSRYNLESKNFSLNSRTVRLGLCVLY